MKKQPAYQVPLVVITVFDHKRNALSEARVTLTPSGNRGKRVSLKFDKQLQAYQSNDVLPGTYMLRAEAGKLESDQRELQVGSAPLRDTFILGPKGLPYYYRGKVKVPFEPMVDFVAAAVPPNLAGKQEEELNAFARELGLQPQSVGEAIRQDNVRVFRFPSRASDKAKQTILVRLAEHPLIRRAGPVIHLYPESVTFLTNDLIVKFKSNVPIDQIPSFAKRFGLEVVRTIPYAGNAFQLRGKLSASYDMLGICDAIVKTGEVEYAEPDLVTTVVLDFIPNDFLFGQQPHHPIINSAGAWDVTRGSNSIVIAVLDNGCDITHPDFQNPPAAGWTKIYSPFDFTGMDANPNNSPDGHGTKSSGIAAAVHDNMIGVAGLASGCRLMPVRYPSGGSDSTYADVYVWIAGFNPGSAIAGFPAPISPGADVISNSFGLYQMALAGIMKDALDFVTTYGRNGKGCVVVFSTGNNNCDFTNCPAQGGARQWAAYEKTIAVSCSRISPPDAAEVKVSTSNFGPLVDVCAPGGGPAGGAETRTLSTTNVGIGTTAGSMGGGSLDYASFGQTSAAAPQVAGVAALMLSAAPNLTWVEVRQILRDTAVKIDMANVDPIGQYVGGYSQWYGFGRINAQAAVLSASTYAFDRDLVVRENIPDMGGVPSAPNWWDSPDIWVRSSDPATDPGPTGPAAYNDPPDPPIHQNAKFGQNNWVYVRFKNRGAAASYDFYVRVYITHWAGPEFVYPNDFEPSTRPSSPLPSPLTPGTYLIGEYHHASLGAGAVDTINVQWPSALVPPQTVLVMGSTVHWHPCLLVEISPHDGPTPTGNHVWDDNNLAQKNITIDYVADDDTFASVAVIGNQANHSQYLELEVDRSAVPPEIQIYVELGDARARERLKKFEYEQQVELGGEGCKIIFLQDTRLIIACPDDPASADRILTMSAKSELDLAGKVVHFDPARYTYKLGSYRGREVIWLAQQGKTRIPVFASGGTLMPIIVGGIGAKGVKPGFYPLGVTQYNASGSGSGALGLSIAVGQKGSVRAPRKQSALASTTSAKRRRAR